MHPFPCSALLTCFGSVRENTPFDQTDGNPLAAEVQKAETDSMICRQPSAKGAGSVSHSGENTGEEMFQASSCSEKHSSASSNSSNHVVAQPAPTRTDPSMLPENEPDHDPITVQTHIPRPSIIGVPKEQQEAAESQKDIDLPVSDSEPLSGRMH
ncbi:mitochondrial inner membrane protease subunit 2 [Platysternon megacephalum]|uniref:Mitochondrial inner membrane protease subunit 2 n=1 Tax=Platysternon megacephalum TaxID=55544 RepID=A0A4D9EUL2_9SAUR|nr:mitochondrial inner membrane protease subunit 2 [Platysternon megacephalum]